MLHCAAQLKHKLPNFLTTSAVTLRLTPPFHVASKYSRHLNMVHRRTSEHGAILLEVKLLVCIAMSSPFPSSQGKVQHDRNSDSCISAWQCERYTASHLGTLQRGSLLRLDAWRARGSLGRHHPLAQPRLQLHVGAFHDGSIRTASTLIDFSMLCDKQNERQKTIRQHNALLLLQAYADMAASVMTPTLLAPHKHSQKGYNQRVGMRRHILR